MHRLVLCGLATIALAGCELAYDLDELQWPDAGTVRHDAGRQDASEEELLDSGYPESRDAGPSLPDGGGDAGSVDGGVETECSADGDCEPGQTCHLGVKRCLKTCELTSTCEGSQTCRKVQEGDTVLTSHAVCTCSSSDDCNPSDRSACDPLNQICFAPCDGDTDCGTGRICDVIAGTCVPKTVCSPACTTGEVCDPARGGCAQRCAPYSCPPATPSCSLYSGICERCTSDSDCDLRSDGNTVCDNGACIARPCTLGDMAIGGLSGPSTCRYGEVCQAPTATCARLPPAACQATSALPWDADAKPPVIYEATATGFPTSNSYAECEGGAPKVEAEISFYAPGGLTWTNTPDLLSKVVFATLAGVVTPAAFVRDAPPSGSTSGKFVAGICGSSSTSGRAVALKGPSNVVGNPWCL